MRLRVGKVTNIYPALGKVKVLYEDEQNTSRPLSMLTMNDEYSMPTVGARVLTVHMENGSSKGFVLGTYYGGSMQPKAGAGYRKDFGDGSYVTCQGGEYLLRAKNITIQAESITLASSQGEITLEDLIKRLDDMEQKLESIG